MVRCAHHVIEYDSRLHVSASFATCLPAVLTPWGVLYFYSVGVHEGYCHCLTMAGLVVITNRMTAAGRMPKSRVGTS